MFISRELYTPQLTPPRNFLLADWFQECIKSQIEFVSESLTEDQEILVELILSNGAIVYPNWIGHRNPNMVVFEGQNQYGHDVQVLIHQSAAQIVITKVPKDAGKPKKSIGFQPITEDASDVADQKNI